MCNYTEICWKNAYSRYFKDFPESISAPPTRQTLMLEGYASIRIYPDRGISAKQIFEPCPLVVDEAYKVESCYEKIQQDKRQRRTAEFYTVRPNIPKQLRIDVSKRCHYCCQYCGVNINSINPINGTRYGGNIDHIIPLSQGGQTIDSNLTLACKRCNNEKSDNMWELGCKRTPPHCV
jgi:5-methylcytosine-specific restriction endonuclease McrA